MDQPWSTHMCRTFLISSSWFLWISCVGHSVKNFWYHVCGFFFLLDKALFPIFRRFMHHGSPVFSPPKSPIVLSFPVMVTLRSQFPESPEPSSHDVFIVMLHQLQHFLDFGCLKLVPGLFGGTCAKSARRPPAKGQGGVAWEEANTDLATVTWCPTNDCMVINHGQSVSLC